MPSVASKIRVVLVCAAVLLCGSTAFPFFQKHSPLPGPAEGPPLVGPGARFETAEPQEVPPEGYDLFAAFKKDNVPVSFANRPLWQGRERCGLNCLYAVLRLCTPGVSYERLERIAGPVPQGGFTLAQLQEIGTRAGADVVAVKGDISRLTELEPPVIVHFGEIEQSGHFVCYARRDSGTMIFLDGTSGTEFTVGGENPSRTITSVLRQASGYMLMPRRVPSGQGTWAVASLMRTVTYFAVAIAGIIFVAAAIHQRSLSKRRGLS